MTNLEESGPDESTEVTSLLGAGAGRRQEDGPENHDSNGGMGTRSWEGRDDFSSFSRWRTPTVRIRHETSSTAALLDRADRAPKGILANRTLSVAHPCLWGHDRTQNRAVGRRAASLFVVHTLTCHIPFAEL